MADCSPRSPIRSAISSKPQWKEEGMRCGSTSNTFGGRTSTNIGHFGVPIRRTSFSIEIMFGADMLRPFSCKERNAMLQLAPRGEIAVPMLELEDLYLPDVKARRPAPSSRFQAAVSKARELVWMV